MAPLPLPVCLLFAPIVAPAPTDGEPTDPEVFECGSPDEPAAPTGSPADSPTVAKTAILVCVTFPDVAATGDAGLPTWLPPMAGEGGAEGSLEAYMRIVSEGAHDLGITFERPAPPLDTEPFLADFDSSYYRTNGYGLAVEEALLEVQAGHPEHPDYLAQFDYAFVVFNGDPFPANWGGIASLGITSIPGSAFSADGYCARLLTPGVSIDSNGNRRHSEWVQVHEYGHVLGLGHTVHSSGSCLKLQGRYAPMQSQVPAGPERGYHPFHVTSLIQLGWFDRVEVVPNQPGTVVQETLVDVRQGGRALEIPIESWAGADEYLLVLNHQGTDYDAGTPARGLAIWHIRNQAGAGSNPGLIDLEVATGLFDATGQPDPVAGTDSLDDGAGATAGDFWSSGSFGAFSNPTTSSYQPVACPTQTSASGVSIENITDQGGAISFDIVFTAVPPAVDLAIDVPAGAFVGLDCDASQVHSLPMTLTAHDALGAPIEGIPFSWLRVDLASLSPKLLLCGGASAVPWSDTDATGSTTAYLFHACGGGDYQATLSFLGTPIATTAPAKLRTPDLNASAAVDFIDELFFINGGGGPPEDDPRDFDFDLDVDQDDADLFFANIDTSLEPDAIVSLLAPASGAQLAAGTTVEVQGGYCFAGGAIPSIRYQTFGGGGLHVEGPDLTSVDWLVTPPLGGKTLAMFGFGPGTLGAADSASVTLVAPKVGIQSLGTTPLTLAVGATGTVNMRLRNNQGADLNELAASLDFPRGSFAVLGGPTSAPPYALAPGQSIALSWTVQRLAGSGGVQADVTLTMDGFPDDPLKTKSFDLFGPTIGHQ